MSRSRSSRLLSPRLVDVIVPVLSGLSLANRRRLGRTIGRAFDLLPTRERLIARLQLDCFLPENATKQPTSGEVFAAVGETALESLNLTEILAAPGAVIVDDNNLIDEIARLSRPTLALTAHLGNWDLLGAYFAKREIPFVVVAREARNPYLQERLVSLRAASGIKTVWRSDKRGLRELRKSFASNLIVAAVIDQDTDTRSIAAPFFGEPAATPIGLIELALRFKARIVSVLCVRHSLPTGQRQYKIRTRLCLGTNTDTVIGEFHSFLQETILLAPEQWVWFHKRWRTTADGRRRSSAEYIQYLKELRQKKLRTQLSER